jgi:hypothetical protein
MSIGKLHINFDALLLSDCYSSGFGTNAGMGFKTPEEFFLAHPPMEVSDIFDPASYIKSEPRSLPACTGPMCTPQRPMCE